MNHPLNSSPSLGDTSFVDLIGVINVPAAAAQGRGLWLEMCDHKYVELDNISNMIFTVIPVVSSFDVMGVSYR